MTNTSGDWGYGGYDTADGNYGWYSTETGYSGKGSSAIGRTLWMAVVVLGAATFAVSLASPVLLGFPVRMPVLAAAVAAVGLLPRQAEHGWIVVALAVAGLLDALATLITADEEGWTLTVITVLNALQFLMAVGALLYETTVARSVDADSARDYSAYANLAAAYQVYAAQYQQQPPTEDVSAGGQATAAAQTQGVAADAAHDSAVALLQAKYAYYGQHRAGEQPYGWTQAPPVSRAADPGMPGANSGIPQSPPYRGRPEEPEMFQSS